MKSALVVLVTLAVGNVAVAGVTYHGTSTDSLGITRYEKPQILQHTYPVRGGTWTGPDGRFIGREEMIRHLLSDGMHKGKFTSEYLNGLSNEEVQSLHSDDHENSVHWNFVKGGATKPVARSNVSNTPLIQFGWNLRSRNCPNGRCPR